MALAAAKTFTKREKVVVFGHGYHGGVLLFPDEKGPHQITVPHGFVVGKYNDVDGTRRTIQKNASEVRMALCLFPSQILKLLKHCYPVIHSSPQS